MKLEDLVRKLPIKGDSTIIYDLMYSEVEKLDKTDILKIVETEPSLLEIKIDKEDTILSVIKNGIVSKLIDLQYDRRGEYDGRN